MPPTIPTPGSSPPRPRRSCTRWSRSPARGSSIRERPDRLWHTARALLRYGTTPAAGYTAAARNFPDEPAIIDELGTLTFKEVDERTNALAHALRRRRRSRRATASRSCAATTAAGSTPCWPARKLGANALFLNTAFSGPQLTDVAKREKPKAVIYDHEFAEVLKDAARAPQALRRLARPGGRQGQGPARWRTLIDARRHRRRSRAPERAGPRDHPHLGHDRARRRAPRARCRSRSTRSPRCCR